MTEIKKGIEKPEILKKFIDWVKEDKIYDLTHSFFTEKVKKKKRKKSTIRLYEQVVSDFLRWTDELSLNQIDPFLEHLKESREIQKSTLKQYEYKINRFFKWIETQADDYEIED